MITLKLLMQVAGDLEDRAADWSCAQPLIERNYSQSIDDRPLAARIVDECAKPYVSKLRGMALESAYMRQQDKMLYDGERNLFQMQVATEILRLRRKKAIRLR